MLDSQPQWQMIANLGDVNPFEHGGFFVFKDLTGQYCNEAVIIEPDEENADKVYYSRIFLEKCYLTNGVLSDNEYHLDSSVFFADDLDSVSSFVGLDKTDLINMLISDNDHEQAKAYQALSGYYDHANFGGEGCELMSQKEAKCLYGRIYQGFLKRTKSLTKA